MKNTVIFIVATLLIAASATTPYQLKCDADLNEQYYNNGCNCAPGCFRMYDGLCRPCPEGTEYYEAAQICESICINNSIW